MVHLPPATLMNWKIRLLRMLSVFKPLPSRYVAALPTDGPKYIASTVNVRDYGAYSHPFCRVRPETDRNTALPRNRGLSGAAIRYSKLANGRRPLGPSAIRRDSTASIPLAKELSSLGRGALREVRPQVLKRGLSLRPTFPRGFSAL